MHAALDHHAGPSHDLGFKLQAGRSLGNAGGLGRLRRAKECGTGDLKATEGHARPSRLNRGGSDKRHGGVVQGTAAEVFRSGAGLRRAARAAHGDVHAM